jgi:hypothetical protein
MPVVTVGVAYDWLAKPGENARTPEQKLTKKVLERTPAWVATAVNEVDGSSLSPEEVIVVPAPMHPWSQNAPTYWFTVGPSDIEGTRDEREERRWAIAHKVRSALQEFINEEDTVYPDHDMECVPHNSSGMSTNVHGSVFQRWGVPDSVLHG